MDFALILEKLRPGGDWGPAVSTGDYDQFAAKWRDAAPCPTLQEMRNEWSVIQSQKPWVAARSVTKRHFLAILADLNALPLAKKNAVWDNFVSGTPPVWSEAKGTNAAAINVLHHLTQTLTLSAANLLATKLRAVAMYVQDHPNYLIHPVFDPIIDVPGVTWAE